MILAARASADRPKARRQAWTTLRPAAGGGTGHPIPFGGAVGRRRPGLRLVRAMVQRQSVRPRTHWGRDVSIAQQLQHQYLRFHRAVYLRTGGLFGHRLAGVPTLILRTKGRRSGETRVAVITYAREDRDFVLVASNFGLDQPPAWFQNVRADPAVEVQVARRRATATARVVVPGDAGYDRLWRLANARNHGRYDAYQRHTSRPIPLVVVSPAAALS